MARGWRRLIQEGMARSGLLDALVALQRPSLMVLAYHNVVPRGETVAGDQSLHLDQADFADQLDLLCETHDVVSLASACEDADASPGEWPRPRAVVTFDDAYRGALTAGLDELGRRGLPSTVFVAPGLLDSEGTWWDRLAPLGGGPLDARLRAHALTRLRGEGARILEWAAEEGLRTSRLPGHARPASTSELRAAAVAPGVTLAVHTWSHPNLATLSREECTREYSRAVTWLEGSGLPFQRMLAYPYGLFGPTAVEAAAHHFSSAFMVSGGFAVRRGQRRGHPLRIPRCNVPRGLGTVGLRVRMAGL